VWLPVLHGVILNVRPARTARSYAEIWRTQTDESPLRYFTRRQAERLAQAFAPEILVDWAMRYGEPSIGGRISRLAQQGARRILIMPLYPQYSATTTASVADAALRACSRFEWTPSLRFAPPFYDDPRYIGALARAAKREIAGLGFEPQHVVISFHGLPQRYFERGDPYPCHCAKTARLLREAMGWSDEFAPLAFQSRFGPGAWLRPSTDEVLAALAARGVKRVAVTTPGFMADCLETLEEIAIRGRRLFLAAGGEQFAALPCLNDADEAIEALHGLIERETAGWTN
jgi:ferrochelatase